MIIHLGASMIFSFEDPAINQPMLVGMEVKLTANLFEHTKKNVPWTAEPTGSREMRQ